MYLVIALDLSLRLSYMGNLEFYLAAERVQCINNTYVYNHIILYILLS